MAVRTTKPRWEFCDNPSAGHSELLRFWTLSIVRYSKSKKKNLVFITYFPVITLRQSLVSGVVNLTGVVQ
jgi:hypothetical protein